MSFCRSLNFIENDKNLAVLEKKYFKSIDSNQVINNCINDNQNNIKNKKINITNEVENDGIKPILCKTVVAKNYTSLSYDIQSTPPVKNNSEIILDNTDILVEINKKKIPRDLICISEFHVEDGSPTIKEDKENKKSPARKKWGVILNVFKVINNMKNVNIKELNSITELENTISCAKEIYQNKKKNYSSSTVEKHYVVEEEAFAGHLEELTKQLKLFDYVSSGLDENIDKIVNIVKNDPSRYLYEPTDKQFYMINQLNTDGFTVLYVACLNGHLNMTNILLKNHADHLQKCGSKGEEQSVLDVSIRWGHIKIVEHLLKLEWPNEFLKSGLKEALIRKNNFLIKILKKSLLENKLKNKKKNCTCFG